MVERINYIPEIKEAEPHSPYVVSEDIVILLQKWAEEKQLSLPSQDFFDDMRRRFGSFMQQIFPSFEFVEENELSDGIEKIVRETGLFPISLDRVYYQSNPGLDISRLVAVDGKDKGLGRRRDYPPLLTQFRDLKKLGVKKAVLVDDVIFSGSLIEKVSNVLEKTGIRIPIICAGIAIGEGVDILSVSGREVQAVKTYDKVVDEVCERDFYPGVPFCGRSLKSNENIGIPYILPFGNPGKWASIPKESQESFSRFCLLQTVKLFEAIEEMSGRYVLCSDLDRKVIGLPKDNTRFTTCLKQILR